MRPAKVSALNRAGRPARSREGVATIRALMGGRRAASHESFSSPRKWMLLSEVWLFLLNTLTRSASKVIGAVVCSPYT